MARVLQDQEHPVAANHPSSLRQAPASKDQAGIAAGSVRGEWPSRGARETGRVIPSGGEGFEEFQSVMGCGGLII